MSIKYLRFLDKLIYLQFYFKFNDFKYLLDSITFLICRKYMKLIILIFAQKK